MPAKAGGHIYANAARMESPNQGVLPAGAHLNFLQGQLRCGGRAGAGDYCARTSLASAGLHRLEPGYFSGTPHRVQGVLTGCTPDAQGVFPCASGEHPLYTPCTRRLGVSCHALVGVGMPGIDVYRSFRPVVCCEGWNVRLANRTGVMCLKNGQPDAVMGVGLLAAEGFLARRCGKLRCALPAVPYPSSPDTAGHHPAVYQRLCSAPTALPLLWSRYGFTMVYGVFCAFAPPHHHSAFRTPHTIALHIIETLPRPKRLRRFCGANSPLRPAGGSGGLCLRIGVCPA